MHAVCVIQCYADIHCDNHMDDMGNYAVKSKCIEFWMLQQMVRIVTFFIKGLNNNYFIVYWVKCKKRCQLTQALRFWLKLWTPNVNYS
jgi:hypothetical protein